MSEPRSANGAVGIAVALLALVPVGCYVAGYLLRSRRIDLPTNSPMSIRYFPTSWEAQIYRPAAAIESFFTAQTVVTQQNVKNAG